MKAVKYAFFTIIILVGVIIYNNLTDVEIQESHSSIIYIEKENYYNPFVGLELPNENNTENGQLFFSEKIILKHILNEVSTDDKNNFITLMENTKITKGLYHRRKNEDVCRTMSHDNLSGIVSASILLKLDIHKDIWEYLKSHNYAYDNCKRNLWPFHPAQYYPWAVANNDNLISAITFPFYLANFIVSNVITSKYSTSSKILYFVELYPLRNDPWGKHFYSSYVYIMKKRYGDNFLSKLMTIYFHQSKKYPIRKLSERITLESLTAL